MNTSPQRFVPIICWLALLAAVALSVWWGLPRVTGVGDLSGVDATIVMGVDRVAAGEPLYEVQAGWPLWEPVYPPLTYLLPGLVARAIGTDFESLYLSVRIVSFLLGIGVLALIATGARTLSPGSGYAALAVALFLGFVPWHRFWLSSRPDVSGLIFQLGGVVAYMALSARGRTTAAPAVALVMAAGALFARHDGAMSICLAVGLDLALSRRWRAAAAFSAGTVAVAAAYYFMLPWVSLTIGRVGRLPSDVPGAISVFRSIIRDGVPLLIAGGVALLSADLWRSGPTRFLAIYGIIAFVRASLMLVAVGAAQNYHFEAFAALAMLSVIALDRALTVKPRAALAGLLLVVVLSTGLLANRIRIWNLQPPPIPLSALEAESAAIRELAPRARYLLTNNDMSAVCLGFERVKLDFILFFWLLQEPAESEAQLLALLSDPADEVAFAFRSLRDPPAVGEPFVLPLGGYRSIEAWPPAIRRHVEERFIVAGRTPYHIVAVRRSE